MKRHVAVAVLGWSCALPACSDDQWTAADDTTAQTRAADADLQPAGNGEGQMVSDKPLRIRSARCPDALANCASAVGRVIFIESVDPDGDGDLHVVATRTKGEAVTGAGLVVFDVAKTIRPKKDPRAGDLVTGAGPVFTGSHGQKQIQVTEFRIKRR